MAVKVEHSQSDHVDTQIDKKILKLNHQFDSVKGIVGRFASNSRYPNLIHLVTPNEDKHTDNQINSGKSTKTNTHAIWEYSVP